MTNLENLNNSVFLIPNSELGKCIIRDTALQDLKNLYYEGYYVLDSHGNPIIDFNEVEVDVVMGRDAYVTFVRRNSNVGNARKTIE